MEEDSLNSGVESLKRTVGQTKSLLEQHRTLLLDTLLRIEEIGKIARETRAHAAAALDQLRENPDDDATRQALESCEALIEPLRESLSQYIADRDYHFAEICTITNAIKVAERMIIEFSTEPGTARH